MGNTLSGISEAERRPRAWGLRRGSANKLRSGARFASTLFVASNDVAEVRPRRRLHRRRRYAPESPGYTERGRDEGYLPSRSDSRESWATARLEQDTGSSDYDSESTTPTSPVSTNTSRAEEKDDPTVIECVICTNSLLPSRFPKRPPTAACDHSPSTCRNCLRKWVNYSFTTRVWDHIDCPECDRRLQHEDVKAFMDPKLVVKYDELAARAAIEAIPGFRWCMAKKCESGQVHDGENLSRFVCVECRAEHCVVHDMPWHKKETCAEYEYRTRGKKKMEQDKKTQKWMGKKTKKCPGCGWSIQKNGGCDHMRCAKCDCEFCYECLEVTVWDEDTLTDSHRPECSNA